MFISSRLCLACKGRLWCGRKKCPILEKARVLGRLKVTIKSNEIFGSTPPSCFIGRFGYPKINTGILLPPQVGDTRILDSPKTWYERRIEIDKVLSFRASLINSRRKAYVKNALNPDKFLQTIQEVAMSSKPVDTEVTLKHKPRIKITFNLHAPPFGPSAFVRRVRLAENPKIKRKVDYVSSDSDLKTGDASLYLYKHGFDVYQISRLLSVGLLGLKIQRRLVPTRWSITAADSIIADSLLNKVKSYPLISDYLLFEANYIGNYFEVLLLPTHWMFEQVEIAIPGGIWTQRLKEPTIIQDHEFYWGRKTYASTTAGAYYASKLAVLEYLERIKRQAGVLIIREIRPEYWAPLGVWKIRECVRDAMKKKPWKFEKLEDALRRIDEVLVVKSKRWKKESKVMDLLLHQKKLDEFLRKIKRTV